MAKFNPVRSFGNCTALVSVIGLSVIPPVFSEPMFHSSKSDKISSFNLDHSSAYFIFLDKFSQIASHDSSNSNHKPPETNPGGSRVSTPNNEPPESNYGGSRGTEICTIAPIPGQTNGEIDSEIWSERPTFIWKGDIQYVELHSDQSGTLIWSQNIPDSQQSISYTGEPLKAGEIYKLSLYDVLNPDFSYPPIASLTFQVVETNQHQKIQQDLEQLEQQMRQQQATAKAIVLARVQYFVEHQLWSDALMESFSIQAENPSLEALLKTKFPTSVCG